MHRIDGEGHDNGQFTDGDPLIPTPATVVTTDWLNAIQEEIVAVITAAGAALNKLSNVQLRDALYALFGRLGVANTWTAKQTLNGGLEVNAVSGAPSINGLGAAHETSGTTMPSKYVLGFAALPTATGANYPLTSLSKMLAEGNTIALNTRALTHGSNPVSDWTEADLEISYDVDSSTGIGGRFRLGSAGPRAVADGVATGSTRKKALTLVGGDLSLDGVAYPNSNVALKDQVTPLNFTKVMVSFQPNAAGPVVLDAMNVLSVVNSGANSVLVTFAQPFAGTAYAATYGNDNPEYRPRSNIKTTSTLLISANDSAGAVKPIGSSMAATTTTIDVTIDGRQ
jgi:hypothetical protein